ncbi:hypothetical protein KDH_66260 [Dictyobacter sp. S3.2.2.5]|uniref:Actin-like protein N-terminal domain-containing protein n=1 Tax=Dictyobacter halimunensis TaxID=3026934 RepID=A0ABQ6G584_9CHLR|nr:hypothetical protein KDH_66260 [Dictyobacter sp. S3.2.2.5]
MQSSSYPRYYAGFEVGSGISGLKVIPVDGLPMGQDLVTLPSFLADGDISLLLKSGDTDATLSSILQPGDYVLSWQDRTYFLGNLLAHGTYRDNAFNDERRYWSDHAQMLLLCLACILIPERCFELRLVTALPVSLYNRERRQLVRHALSQTYHVTFNGREREVIVRCGYVAMEGQGILIHYGDETSEQAVIDIGERTTDLIAASGQRLIGRLCKGDQFGVGQLVEDLQQMGLEHRRKITTEKAHALLQAYAHQQPYPPIKTANGHLAAEHITTTIEQSIQRLARPLSSFLAGAWNVEEAPPGSQFDTIYLGGGGAYYFEKIVRATLQDCHIITIPEPQDANICGYADLAQALDEDRWEMH